MIACLPKHFFSIRSEKKKKNTVLLKIAALLPSLRQIVYIFIGVEVECILFRLYGVSATEAHFHKP